MEQYLNGKIEEREKVEKDEKVDIEGEECESVREILIDENSESVRESHDAEEKETSMMQDPEESKKGEEKEVTESNEVIVETSIEVESGGIDHETKGIDVRQEDGLLIGARESSMWPQSTEEKNSPYPVIKEEQSGYAAEGIESNEVIVETSVDCNVIEVESEGIDVGQEDGLLNGARVSSMWANGDSETKDKNSPCSVIKEEQSKGIEEEVVVSSLNENSHVVERGIEIEDIKVDENSSVNIVDEKSVENIDDSLKPSANAIIVGSNDAFPQTTPNPHVISISQRTSWRSCCGLLRVLTRSNS